MGCVFATAEVYFGRQYEVQTERAEIKRLTMKKRKTEYRAARAAYVKAENRLLAKSFSDLSYSLLTDRSQLPLPLATCCDR